ncbi:MAG TPA: hypothetical protein PKJ10_01385 [Smithella sp.]|nr:hypothetical protein [Smithella sp.]
MANNNFNEDRNAFLQKADALLRENNMSAILNLAGQRLQNHPADADALGIYCEALIGMGKIEEMRQWLIRVAEIISGLNLVHERAGDACRENGFHQEAAACYEKFISLRPDAEKAVEIIGKMALLEQEDKPVVSAGDKEEIPEREFFTVTLAQLYIDQGHLQDAEVILEEIVKKEPSNEQAMTMLDELRSAMQAPSLTENKTLSSNDKLIRILSGWLKNIERLKMNAASR